MDTAEWQVSDSFELYATGNKSLEEIGIDNSQARTDYILIIKSDANFVLWEANKTYRFLCL